MALQWMKQPDGTLVLWDPAKGGAPLTASPEGPQAMPGTDTTDAARQLFEDKQGTRAPSPIDLLASQGPEPPPTTGDARIDFNALVNALLSKPQDLEGGQTVGAVTPEGAGYTPAGPTTGEETSAPVPKAKVGKTKAGAYSGGEAFVRGMIKRGWTPEEAAGVAGNVHVESGFRSEIKSSAPTEQSYGFLQWNKERLQGLKNMAASKGLDWRDPETQMDWIHMERTGESTKYGGGDERTAYKKALSGGGSPAQIAERFGRYVERPKDLSQSVEQRKAAAIEYAKFGAPKPNVPTRTEVAKSEVPFSGGQTLDEELASAILGQGKETPWV